MRFSVCLPVVRVSPRYFINFPSCRFLRALGAFGASVMNVEELIIAARAPSGATARISTLSRSAPSRMYTLTELQTRLEFASMLEKGRRHERELLSDKFMPGLADRFMAENLPCATFPGGRRPSRTSAIIKAQFVRAGQAMTDPIDDDDLTTESKLDAIEAQAPNALLETPERIPSCVGALAKSIHAGSDHLRLSEPLPRHETLEGWSNATVVIGRGAGAEMHRVRSIDASGTGTLPPIHPSSPPPCTTLRRYPPLPFPPSLFHPLPAQCCTLAGRLRGRTLRGRVGPRPADRRGRRILRTRPAPVASPPRPRSRTSVPALSPLGAASPAMESGLGSTFAVGRPVLRGAAW